MLRPWAQVLVAMVASLATLGAGALARPARPLVLRALPELQRAETTRFSAEARARRADVFASTEARGFKRLGEPAPGDWLAELAEPGQTLAEFERDGLDPKSRTRRVLHLQMLGAVPKGAQQMLVPVLREYLTVYFDVPVEVLPAAPGPGFAPPEHPAQIDARAAVAELAERVPRPSLALVGVTGEDAFVADSAFVFGFGLLHRRAAVLSLHRFMDDPRQLLRRTLKVAVHEIGHTLGLEHCVFYECVMNGANTLEELDRIPLAACPVCSAKIARARGLDAAERERRLAEFHRRWQLDDAGTR